MLNFARTHTSTFLTNAGPASPAPLTDRTSARFPRLGRPPRQSLTIWHLCCRFGGDGDCGQLAFSLWVSVSVCECMGMRVDVCVTGYNNNDVWSNLNRTITLQRQQLDSARKSARGCCCGCESETTFVFSNALSSPSFRRLHQMLECLKYITMNCRAYQTSKAGKEAI